MISYNQIQNSVKVQLLKKEFTSVGVQPDQKISFSQLIYYLDQKNFGEFDRDVAQQFFERMEKDYNQSVTVNDFINVWLEAEDLLQQKSENCKKLISDYSIQYEEALAKLEEVRRNEQQNAFGIMKNSNVQVQIVEAQNLRSSDHQKNIDPYVIITCGENRGQTQVQKGASPYFNETFNFQVESGLEDIHITVMDYDQYTRDDFIGHFTIPLNRLSNQYKQEQWFDLYDRTGQVGQGRIHVVMQWIHSRVKYLGDIVNQWDEQIRYQQEDLQEYQNDLNIIYHPFKSIIDAYSGANINQLLQSGNQQIHQEKPKSSAKKILNDAPKNINHLDLLKNDQTLQLKVFVAIYLVFLLFVSYNRAVFFDIMFASATLIFLFQQPIDIQNFNTARILLGALGIQFVQDLIWLIIFSSGLWNGSNSVADPSEIRGTNQFVVFLSYLIFFAKLPLGYMLFLIYQKLSLNPNTSNPNTLTQPITTTSVQQHQTFDPLQQQKLSQGGYQNNTQNLNYNHSQSFNGNKYNNTQTIY